MACIQKPSNGTVIRISPYGIELGSINNGKSTLPGRVEGCVKKPIMFNGKSLGPGLKIFKFGTDYGFADVTKDVEDVRASGIVQLPRILPKPGGISGSFQNLFKSANKRKRSEITSEVRFRISPQGLEKGRLKKCPKMPGRLSGNVAGAGNPSRSGSTIFKLTRSDGWRTVTGGSDHSRREGSSQFPSPYVFILPKGRKSPDSPQGLLAERREGKKKSCRAKGKLSKIIPKDNESDLNMLAKACESKEPVAIISPKKIPSIIAIPGSGLKELIEQGIYRR